MVATELGVKLFFALFFIQLTFAWPKKSKHPTDIGKRNIILGERTSSPEPTDILLYDAAPFGRHSRKKNGNQYCYPSEDSSVPIKITRIEIMDMTDGPFGGLAYIDKGGVGHSKVCIFLKTKSGAYHFGIKIYGYSNIFENGKLQHMDNIFPSQQVEENEPPQQSSKTVTAQNLEGKTQPPQNSGETITPQNDDEKNQPKSFVEKTQPQPSDVILQPPVEENAQDPPPINFIPQPPVSAYAQNPPPGHFIPQPPVAAYTQTLSSDYPMQLHAVGNVPQYNSFVTHQPHLGVYPQPQFGNGGMVQVVGTMQPQYSNGVVMPVNVVGSMQPQPGGVFVQPHGGVYVVPQQHNGVVVQPHVVSYMQPQPLYSSEPTPPPNVPSYAPTQQSGQNGDENNEESEENYNSIPNKETSESGEENGRFTIYSTTKETTMAKRYHKR